ncbi:helix-turn-helix domain-containing protein [Virgibacillus sp. W0181]|uniref:helix-turn-helix domain-containing protein n=1 Tax=Virgibacillus sp. W0181 TaxID=3391581 RepID=UPI003F463C33
MLLKSVILTCFDKLQKERSSSAVYHILTAKRSIQTIQDIHLYQLQSFYGIYKTLKKSIFEHTLHQMNKDGLLNGLSEEAMVHDLTPAGEKWLKENYKVCSLHYFNGIMFEEMSLPFAERLLLLIQVFTNSRMNHNTYIPVVDKREIELWVKKYYKQMNNQQENFLEKLYNELEQILDCFSNKEAEIFVQRLTGYKYYGKSMEQIAIRYASTFQDVHLLLERTLHRMLQIIITNKTTYPLLFSIIKDLVQTDKLTQSARKTYYYLDKQYTPHEIAKIRKLTVNTVYDHIVEIAVDDKHFPIETYVDQFKQKEIMNAVQRSGSYKLKSLKQYVSEEITYFQIRLVLTMITHIKGGEEYEPNASAGDTTSKTF